MELQYVLIAKEISNMLCEICEHQEKTGGKYCDDCRDDFKTSEDDK
jgi:hypothetical protein